MSELREAMARALAARRIGSHDPTGALLPDDLWQQGAGEADAALAAIEAAGWVVVPREPVVPMFRALTESWRAEGNDAAVGQWMLGSFIEDYQAMLDAAPKP